MTMTTAVTMTRIPGCHGGEANMSGCEILLEIYCCFVHNVLIQFSPGFDYRIAEVQFFPISACNETLYKIMIDKNPTCDYKR